MTRWGARVVAMHPCHHGACQPATAHPRRLPSARKRLAVPYRAAQMPSERSEFAQPDVALLLTAISYFKDGALLGLVWAPQRVRAENVSWLAPGGCVLVSSTVPLSMVMCLPAAVLALRHPARKSFGLPPRSMQGCR